MTAKRMDRDAELFRLASAARTFLEPFWVRWRQSRSEPVPAIPSAHTCGRSSLFLRNALRLEEYPAEWANGIPRNAEERAELGPFGFFSGWRWESHAWVVSGDHILDITADQFGADPVIVTSLSDARYRSGGGDTATPSAIRARHDVVEALWPEWVSHRATLPG